MHDIQLAWRGLCRSKRFTAAAVTVLAVGIAGVTVILALVQGVLRRPMPVVDQERVILAWKDLKASGYQHYPFGDRAIERVAEQSRLLERVAGVTTNGVSHWIIADDSAAAYVRGALITGAFFDVLGAKPLLGRRLAPADDFDGSEPVVVISAGFWQRRYGGSRDVIGRRITLDDHTFSIVGVMPADIDYPRGVELWRATHSVPLTETFGDAGRQEVDLIARLRPGVTLAQAADELSTLTRQFEAEALATAGPGLTPVVRPFAEAIVGDTRPAILGLLIAVALVLLIASANVANLQLLRGEARRAELAVCMALGAGAGRLVRQLLIESAMLSLLSTGVGVAATWGGLRWLLTLVPDGLPRIESIRVDGPVILTVTILTTAVSFLAALGPAFLSTRLDPAPELRGGGRGITAGATRLRRGLVVAQVALAVTVVSCAALLTRTVLRLQAVDVGVALDHLALVFLEMPKAKAADQARHAQFLATLVEALEAVPGIAAATPVNLEPFTGGWGVPRFVAEGQSAERAATNPALGLEAVHERYFETLGVRIVRGRAFTAADRKGAREVAIVSEDVAERTWPGEDPIGKRLKWGSPSSKDPWLTIVGIAAPTRYQDLTTAKPILYVPAVQFIVSAQRLMLRTTAPIEAVAPAVRARVAAVDASVRVMRIAPFTALFDAPLARPRFNALLLGVFAVVALFLAGVGHYAVIAAHVRHREREIAVRMALGATPWQVRGLVLAEAFWLTGLGAAIGVAGALGATRLLRAMLFQAGDLDALSLAGAAALLILAVAAASFTPLRRAARVDALTILRA